MKTNIALSTFLLICCSLASAAEYRIPTEDPALEPFATHQLDAEVDNSNHTITYTIPESMTGMEDHFQMKKIREKDGMRSFEGTRAKGTCTGSLESPVCTIAFKPGGIQVLDVVAQNEALSRIYRNPVSFRLAVSLVNDSLVEEQPIGILDLNERNDLDIFTHPIRTRYSVNGSSVNATVCLARTTDGFQGFYRYGNRWNHQCHNRSCDHGCSAGCACGNIVDGALNGKYVSAYWQVGNSSGWIEWIFDEQDKFSGSYSFSDTGTADGTWRSAQ